MGIAMAIDLNQLITGGVGFENREDVISIVDSIALKQLALMYGQNKALVNRYGAAHYDQGTTKIEHICRLMWGIVPMGAEGEQHHQAVLGHIVTGTTPSSSDYWQMPSNYDQRVVEMSSIAVAVVEQAEFYWLPLTAVQKVNLVNWLSSVASLEIPANNWRWFRILILSALKQLEQPINEQVLAKDLAFVDSLYLKDGWYQDGTNGVVDYYNPFAFQLYALMYCRWNAYQGELCAKFVSRAIEFSHSYQAWFGDDGKQLAYGRSLNYRFAAAGFWAELARADDDRIDVSVCRDIWTHTLNWWANQSIWDSHAQLLPGFGYANLLSSEFYTSSVSPMLALKAFNALSMPADHPFWQHKVQPLSQALKPVWIADRHLVWRNGGSYLITNSPASAELRNCSDKYNKCAYSSDHGLCVESERWIEQSWVGDNIFAVKHPETQQWFGINKERRAQRVGDSLISQWQPFAGCRIQLTQTLTDGKETRDFIIECEHPVEFVLSGYAVNQWTAWFSHCERDEASVESSQLYSQLRLEKGEGICSVYPCAPNTNLLYQHASVPVIRGDLTQGKNQIRVLVSAGRLTPSAPAATNSNTSNNSHQGVTDEY